MSKNVFVSIREGHDVLDKVIKNLKQISNLNIIIHRPFKDKTNLTETINQLKNVDYLILKASNQISMDILYFAKLYNIPALHDFDAVTTCRSKIMLDSRLREILMRYKNDLEDFLLPIPESWVSFINEKNLEDFKNWAKPLLPLVLKSHDQHEKYVRYSYLVRADDEIDDFHHKFQDFLKFPVYIQKKIECDDIDRKIYVIGDKIFGVQRESPISICLRNNLDVIDVDSIEKFDYTVSDKVKMIAKILAKELNLKLFGFDLIKSANQDKYYLIDVNDFPGFRGVKNIVNILVDFFKNLLDL